MGWQFCWHAAEYARHKGFKQMLQASTSMALPITGAQQGQATGQVWSSCTFM